MKDGFRILAKIIVRELIDCQLEKEFEEISNEEALLEVNKK